MEHKFIIPECYGDTVLVEMIGFKKPNHQKGIGNVNNVMVKKFDGRKVIGIVDNDKKLSADIKNLAILKSTDDLILKKRPQSEHYFIILIPALERWLLKCETITGISRSDARFDLPTDFDRFKKMVKNQNIGENVNFVRFLKALIAANPEPIATLKSWLDELVR